MCIISAVWKLSVGLFIVLVELDLLRKAAAGDGWLRLSAQALGYWAAWAIVVYFSVRLYLSRCS